MSAPPPLRLRAFFGRGIAQRRFVRSPVKPASDNKKPGTAWELFQNVSKSLKCDGRGMRKAAPASEDGEMKGRPHRCDVLDVRFARGCKYRRYSFLPGGRDATRLERKKSLCSVITLSRYLVQLRVNKQSAGK